MASSTSSSSSSMTPPPPPPPPSQSQPAASSSAVHTASAASVPYSFANTPATSHMTRVAAAFVNAPTRVYPNFSAISNTVTRTLNTLNTGALAPSAPGDAVMEEVEEEVDEEEEEEETALRNTATTGDDSGDSSNNTTQTSSDGTPGPRGTASQQRRTRRRRIQQPPTTANDTPVAHNRTFSPAVAAAPARSLGTQLAIFGTSTPEHSRAAGGMVMAAPSMGLTMTPLGAHDRGMGDVYVTGTQGLGVVMDGGSDVGMTTSVASDSGQPPTKRARRTGTRASAGTSSSSASATNPLPTYSHDLSTMQWVSNPHQTCALVFDADLNQIPPPSLHLREDKGFRFHSPRIFICQKKNHFQLTLRITTGPLPCFAQSKLGTPVAISRFEIHLNGIKVESPDMQVQLHQSESDRRRHPFRPLRVHLAEGTTQRLSIGRLHFSQPTANNMRRHGGLNPDQRFFALAVNLVAICDHDPVPISSMLSDRIVVRGSNPRQFESDPKETQHHKPWYKGQTRHSACHFGPVGINIPNPDEALCVLGNIRLTGNLLQTSDARLKTVLGGVSPEEAFQRISNVRLHRFVYKDGVVDQNAAAHGNSNNEAQESVPRSHVGVLAQEMQDVYPEAVHAGGTMRLQDSSTTTAPVSDVLCVDTSALLYDAVGAVQHLAQQCAELRAELHELKAQQHLPLL
ncbi:hypothetical protein PTSG_00654 [Salpingoeca rosetta]|uniref:NDT80 domain-containing protein n=1 Tax=Salpingoeca rosetta (strain ATCC 50818 / BSB-021) TaxID=946362 RepID=F2TX38_SALR5|nr:uncharacterized protein PTSG_00654 [Salpingoeca rosetta]EGD75947.1 hypothetical protein PTSG_00654 [Salpingoeca rosetta]|eukprot:XP_004998123.1 hypothetical protein PTSG_00654 [Salpingoeca rosetta]